jgi:hypothetical protein
MGEHLRTAPFPILAVYGAVEDGSMAKKLASFMEKTRLKPLKWARDYALPLKKMTDRRYETYTPPMILKKGWTAKHQEHIPGGLLVVYETDALTQTTLAGAVSLLDRVRANVVTSGRSGLPVALAVVSISDEPPTSEEKASFISQLKKATSASHQNSANSTHVINIDRTTLRTPSSSLNQPPPCALAVFTRIDIEEETDGVSRFRVQLIDAIHEHYKLEIARIKALKRGERRSGATALKARHEFKCAQYYEMRSLPDKALIHYQEAYQALVALASTWEKEQTSEYHAHEIRSASEIVHYRMCALRLEAGEPRPALSQLRLHFKSMIPLRDPSYDQDEYWEWLSRQHILFAGLLSSSSTSALTIAFGALDPCERERCSGLYHLSRAAIYAKKISKPERALDLNERMVEANARKRKAHHTRREAALLLSVAEERYRIGDENGALRDMERACMVFKKGDWFSLFVRTLTKMDSMFNPYNSKKLSPSKAASLLALQRTPSIHNDVESQFIALYSDNQTQQEHAIEYLCNDKGGATISIESSLIEATMDEGGRRILLTSRIRKSLGLKMVQCSDNSETDFGLKLVNEFSSEIAVIPPLGTLLVDAIDETQLQNASTLLLSFATGAKWKVQLKSAGTPLMFQLKRSDSLSSHSENHPTHSHISKKGTTIGPNVDDKKQYELICEGFPPDFRGFIGESFRLELALSDPNEKCVIECECEASWIRIHGSTVPGHFTVEISPQNTDTTFADSQSLKTTIQMTAFVGMMQLCRKHVDLSVVSPISLFVCKRLKGPKCLLELESNSIPILILSSPNLLGMEGEWSPTERRSGIVELSPQSSRLDFTVARTAGQSYSASVGPWNISIPLPPIDETIFESKVADDLDCLIEFRPLNPFLYLGEEISMKMFIRFKQASRSINLLTPDKATESPLSNVDSGINSQQSPSYKPSLGRSDSTTSSIGGPTRSVRLVFEQVNGFFVSGPDTIGFNLYPEQETFVNWTLFPYEVGPQRFPGIWLEVSQGNVVVSKRRVEATDSFCVVLPANLEN